MLVHISLRRRLSAAYLSGYFWKKFFILDGNKERIESSIAISSAYLKRYQPQEFYISHVDWG